MSQKSDILRKKLVLVNATSNITFAESLILVCWSLFLIKLQAKTCNLSRTKFHTWGLNFLQVLYSKYNQELAI